MTLRGQTQNPQRGGSSEKERGGLHSPTEVASSSLAPRSTPILQAMAAGLQLDPLAVAAGRKDGLANQPFRPLSFDVLAYASGFYEGGLYRPRSPGGPHALVPYLRLH